MSGKKRLAVVIVVVFIVFLALTLSVFAAADSVGGGFSLWNLLDGLGGFFRDLINSIGGFFVNLISALKNAANFIVDAVLSVVKAIGNAIGFLLSGLKALFIPSKESFSKFRDDILTRYDDKFGSVFSALNYLKIRFGMLTAKSGLTESFKIIFPRGSFLYGISIDLLASPYDVIMFIRGCLTGFYCLSTGLICYHKVIAMTSK